MIKEKELTIEEINKAVGQHNDVYGDITRHIRAIACMREPSWLKFSLEDGSNSTRQLRRYKTPKGVNAAVTWFLQGMRFGTDTNEADWQENRLGGFMASLVRLSNLLGRPATVNEVYEVFRPSNPKNLLDFKPLKEFNPAKEISLV